MIRERGPLLAVVSAMTTALVMVLSVVLGGCGTHHAETAAGASAAGADSGASRPLAASPSAQPSLYELSFSLTDAEGHARHLSEFKGQPFVASMIYTHCTSVCPRITSDLQALDRALPAQVRAHTRFVLFSLDPERDTPAALRSFAHERNLDLSRWTLLAAGPEDMRTLAAVLDVRFRPDAEGEIAHSAVIVVVGRDGVIRYRQAGLTGDSAPLVAAVRAVE